MARLEEPIEGLLDVAREALGAEPDAHRGDEADDDARDGGVHARGVGACPGDEGRRDVRELLADAEELQQEDGHDAERGDAEAPERDARGVEEGDDEDGAEVVDDREREEQHPERGGDALAEEAEDAEREGDVGRHGDAPARARGRRARDGEVDERRGDHAPERSGRRERGAAPLGKLALVHLAADLHPHDEEEDDHEAIVDDPFEGALEGEITEPEADGRVPEVDVARAPGRVLPGDRSVPEGRRGDGWLDDTRNSLPALTPAGWRPDHPLSCSPGAAPLVNC